MMSMDVDIERVLFDRDAIARRVESMGKQIAADLDKLTDRPGEIVLIPILTARRITGSIPAFDRIGF